MGSAASRETVIDSKWWEAEAHHTLTTATDPRKVEQICSLIPVQDDKTLLRPLMGRPDLDTLFTLHCGRRELPGHESENPSKVTDDIKAQKLWRVLRPPSGYHAPWDWNWPLSGDPRQIADDFHAVVSRAIFGVPLFDFVKCALRYNNQALFNDALLDAACDARNSLQRAIQGLRQTKDTYIEVEKILWSRYHLLAHWIVASSLYNTARAPYDALASTLDPIKNLFTTRNLDFVLKRIAVLAGYGNEDEDQAGGTWRRVWSVIKRFRRARQQTMGEIDIVGGCSLGGCLM
ncbi:hypothetical protein BKA65DRAFT_557458 [Rhexocercosporidium sp. MPI-PUGE-AT-0058]|nr:hypothetical protein BKA65DRAFT_557458 [Rhexocercosporidium sp. MPI-PUGE-AT-0058]